MSIQVRNPHSVLAALRTRPSDVIELILPPSQKGGASGDDAWDQVARIAREKGIKTRSGSGGGRPGPGNPNKNEGGRTGASEATLKDKQPVSIEELFQGAREKGGGNGLWLALDSLQDPHNLGAIFRTASFFGVQGIVMTQERSAPLTGAAYDVSCGGIEDVPFAIQVNLQRAFEKAKEAGLWILGTSEHAHDNIASIQKDRPWLLVLGNEEKGLRRLTEESCDLLCKVPSVGGVTSLNVSVAAGIFISRLA